MILLKNANIYSPEFLGKKDLLICNDKIIKIAEEIKKSEIGLELEEIDCSDKIIAPGYIDQHVHMIGGGGEAGFYSRTPEVMLSKAIEAGITTMVGVLGTDGTTRHLESLLAKAGALETEGISTYMLTGSYEIPVNTLTGSVRRDVILIDKVLGVGEIAISDHRSSQPTIDEIKKIVTEARLGGMLSGKAGILQLHMGDGKTNLDMIFKILEETEIPIRHFIPTHINRNKELFLESVKFAKMGGYVDITSGISGGFGSRAMKPSKAIKALIDEGVDTELITMSSDGNGSMAVYDEKGNVAKLLVTYMDSLHKEIEDCVKDEGVNIEDAIKVVTSNVAKALKIYPAKGCINVGSDADIVLIDKDFSIDSVIAKGKFLMRDKSVLTKGTFE